MSSGLSKKVHLELNGSRKTLILNLNWASEFLVNFVYYSFGLPTNTGSQFVPVTDPKGNTYSLVGSLQELDSNTLYKMEQAALPYASTPPKGEKDGFPYSGSSTGNFYVSTEQRSRRDSRRLNTPPTFDRQRSAGTFFEDRVTSLFREGFGGFGDLDHFVVTSEKEFEKMFSNSSFKVGLLVSTQKDFDKSVFPSEITSLIKKHAQEVGLYFMPIKAASSYPWDDDCIKFTDFSNRSIQVAGAVTFLNKEGRSKKTSLEETLKNFEQELFQFLIKSQPAELGPKPKNLFGASRRSLDDSKTNISSPRCSNEDLKRHLLSLLDTEKFKSRLPRALRTSLRNQVRAEYRDLMNMFLQQDPSALSAEVVLSILLKYSTKSPKDDIQDYANLADDSESPKSQKQFTTQSEPQKSENLHSDLSAGVASSEISDIKGPIENNLLFTPLSVISGPIDFLKNKAFIHEDLECISTQFKGANEQSKKRQGESTKNSPEKLSKFEKFCIVVTKMEQSRVIRSKIANKIRVCLIDRKSEIYALFKKHYRDPDYVM